MKKFLLLLVIGFVISLSTFTVFADTDTVEISLRVGESTLNINGESIEVEAPFIVDGTTLVPVRVITEAFGADVDWNPDTRQVTLTYRNVEIVLQIDNINVYINNQRQSLLAEPRLSSGVTMVPLRFISENFGADVGWNESTQAVTVTKNAVGGAPISDIQNVLQGTNMPMVGDSYFGWSMRRTPSMELWHRQFDGRCNIFALSDYAFIDIDHFDNFENETFEAVRATEMEIARRYTLVSQEVRRTPSGAEFVVTQFRDRFDFTERRAFVRGDNIVIVSTIIDASVSVAARNECLAVVNTFDFVFRAHETEDLSNVVDGMRLFENEELAISFRVPAEWFEIPDFHRMNRFWLGNFYDTVILGASLEVVSAQSGDSAERWARETLERDQRVYNPRTHTFSGLRTTQVDGTAANYFQVQGTLGGVAFNSRQIFWEYQGYMYNLYITVSRGNEALIQRIVDSVSFDAIDPDVIGTMMREPISNAATTFSTVQGGFGGFRIDVPTTWARLNNNTIFLDEQTGVSVNVLSFPAGLNTLEELRDSMGVLEELGSTIIRQPASVPNARLAASMRGYVVEYRLYLDDASWVNMVQYIVQSDNTAFLISIAFPEHADSPFTRDIAATMIRSFTFN